MQTNLTVVFSADNILLSRLSTELMMDGFQSAWINHSDFGSTRNKNWDQDFKWVLIDTLSKDIGFHSHECKSATAIRLWLTPKNYSQVLKTLTSI